MSHLQAIRDILNKLANEHGTEAFVSDGYGYYEDAETFFAALVSQVERETLERARKDYLDELDRRILNERRAQYGYPPLGETTQDDTQKKE